MSSSKHSTCIQAENKPEGSELCVGENTQHARRDGRCAALAQGVLLLSALPCLQM